MFKTTKTADDRVEIEVSGRIDAEAMRDGLDELVAASIDMRGAKMLYTITDLALPTPAALAVEFSRLPQLFSLISRFDRAAVLSDLAWIRTAAEVEGALIPRLKIKAFELGERAAAEAWLDA